MSEAARWLAQARRDLAGEIPADAYTRTDGDRALGLCAAVIALVEEKLADRT